MKIIKSGFFLIIFFCVGYGLYASYQRSKSYDPSGKPNVRHLQEEIEPFAAEFGGRPIKTFDRTSVAGALSQNISISNPDLIPIENFRATASRLGWLELSSTKSPYSSTYRFCKRRLMLSLEHVSKSYWNYGVSWVSDGKSERYCKQN
ncbi:MULTISPECIES: hypothetical protein [unclassified Xanthomonas]|uniref:hypothetical protein n=1 Tax=unclassified Xanthomonas TaxID=2643310 RepID=UPI0021E05A81|nr:MULTISPECIES: hypothetical protein [unclassified Xanthomonas]UYC20715.1 hypothetical protein NUG20_21745 [Xanthomonas sp. CFBP 8443]